MGIMGRSLPYKGPNATNVKIITRDSVVTLRGPVESQQEKTTVETIARKVEGVKRVENQLEVAAK